MYFPFRYSLNIEKQILWYLLAIIFFSKKYKKILDAGCGLGQNIRFLKFKEYLGIDIDPLRREKNREKFNLKKFKFKSHDIIQDKLKIEKKFDLVILIQVLTNSLFNKKEVKTALRNLTEVCEGKFVFNTSYKNKDKINEIDSYIKESNIKFKKIYYGIPQSFRKIKLPIISQITAFIFLLIILSNNKVMSNVKILYICKID
tara:strand:- start:77 stop:682 length:606 start_codon:yes stop_codon:yes gene_type:complete